MSELLFDLGLRLLKVGLGVVLGLLIYAVLTGPFEAPGSAELAILSFLAAAAGILLAETGFV